MTIRARITRTYRDFPIEVQADLNTVKQVELLPQIFDEIAKIVDRWHKTKALQRERWARKTKWNTVRQPERAMSFASTFLFKEVRKG